MLCAYFEHTVCVFLRFYSPKHIVCISFTLNVEVGNRLKPWMPGNKHKYLHQAFPFIMAFFTFPGCAGFSLPAVFFLSILFGFFESDRVLTDGRSEEY